MSAYQPGAVLNPLHAFFFFPLIITAQHFLVRKLRLRKISEFAEGQLCP